MIRKKKRIKNNTVFQTVRIKKIIFAKPLHEPIKVVFLQPQIQSGEVGEWLKPTVC